MKVSFFIHIPYSDIDCLKEQLDEDSSINAKIGRPQTAPRNHNTVVKIKVVAITQGKDHLHLIKQSVKFCGGSILDTLHLTKAPFKSMLKEWGKEIWLPFLLIYSALVGSVVTTVFSFTIDPAFPYFVMLSIPTALGLASSPILVRRIL